MPEESKKHITPEDFKLDMLWAQVHTALAFLEKAFERVTIIETLLLEKDIVTREDFARARIGVRKYIDAGAEVDKVLDPQFRAAYDALEEIRRLVERRRKMEEEKENET